MDTLFLKPLEAARALAISRSKVYDLIHRRELPAIRISGVLRVPRRALKELEQSALNPSKDESGAD